ncbi:MAG TPA: ABC transporter ATP-binding protein, partial [Candidatus Thermoplasmatota archaeon]|nr:ABC transporter ATP-binding protein [Candidatus Thermoplasmatota archaeon]
MKRRFYRRAFGYLRPVWGTAWFAVLLSLLVAVANVIDPIVLKFIFDSLTAGRLSGLLWGIGFLLALAVLRETFQAIGNWFVWRVRLRLQYDLTEAVVERLHTLPLSYHRQNSVGATLTRLERGVSGFVGTLAELLFNVVPAIFFLVTAAMVMLVLDWRLSLVAFAFLPLPLVLAALTSPEQVRRERDLLSRWTALYARFNEVLSGILTVKSFLKEDEERRRFLNGVRDANAIVSRGVLRDSRNGALRSAVTVLARVAVIAYGGYLVLRGEATIGTLVAFLGFVGALFGPVMSLGGVYQSVRRGKAALETVYNVLDAQDRLGDVPGATQLQVVQGRVDFENVTFAYEQGRPILQGITFRVDAGETVALVGPSGAGKSTVVMLLQRLYDPTSGRVLVDGQDVRLVRQRSLRAAIGFVPQEPILFDDSVRAAIAYPRPTATQQEVEDAARRARAHDFILQLPQGYETHIGERGSLLSAGQRQRLAVARVLLKDPKILILDEATSALDAENEALLQEALADAMKGRTTFIIAHRLSTVVNADRIMVLEGGRIVEEGKHAELVARRGRYWQLVSRQTRGLLP